MHEDRVKKYFNSLSDEIQSVKNRIRHFIGEDHYLSDGEWKETILRTILRRHLPETVGVGTGFIKHGKIQSTQIDIIIYDKSKPTLFNEGDFVIITPDCLLGAIEVKTKVGCNNFKSIIEKIEVFSTQLRKVSPDRPFLGLFGYELGRHSTNHYFLEKLQETATSFASHNIHCASLGKDIFIRYWDFDPISGSHEYDKWHIYNLDNKASAYFIHNVIEHISPNSVYVNAKDWYPGEGKENNKLDEIDNLSNM